MDVTEGVSRGALLTNKLLIRELRQGEPHQGRWHRVGFPHMTFLWVSAGEAGEETWLGFTLHDCDLGGPREVH